MPTSPSQPAGGIERFSIARGAVSNIRPVIITFMAAVIFLLAAFFVLVLALGIAAKGLAFVAPATLIGLVATLIVYLNLPGRLELGADGVLVDWRGQRRYVPFAELADALPYVEQVMGKTFIGVTLTLRSGEAVKVPIGEDQFGADKRVTQITTRVRAALDAYLRRDEGDDASLLARGDRSLEAWRERLRGLGAGANAGPREAPIPTDRLLRIVEDPAAEAPVRAGAAFALASSLDEDSKQRLRIAASSTVAPQLRIALESVAAGDEEAAIAALAEIEQEGSRRA